MKMYLFNMGHIPASYVSLGYEKHVIFIPKLVPENPTELGCPKLVGHTL